MGRFLFIVSLLVTTVDKVMFRECRITHFLNKNSEKERNVFAPVMVVCFSRRGTADDTVVLVFCCQ